MAESACRMPTEAELDWMMPVSTAPTSTPRIGFLKARKRFVNAGTCERPETAPLIVSMPNMSVAKPRRMVPVSFFFASLQNI